MPTSSKKEKILIIEGNTALGEKMSKTLKTQGYIVFLVTTGEEGLKAIYDTLPQLVIVDLLLPDIDGYEILAKKHADVMLSKIPVFLLSTQGSPLNMRKVPEGSVADFIVALDPDPSDIASRLDKYFSHDTDTDEVSSAKNTKSTSKGKKVFWVEDDKLIGSILAKKFISAGFELAHFTNGEEGFSYLKTNTPDIIILDVMLPGMDGFEILQKAHMEDRLKKVPSIILSNLSKASDFEKAKLLGASKYLVKAASSLDQIVEEVRKLTN